MKYILQPFSLKMPQIHRFNLLNPEKSVNLWHKLIFKDFIIISGIITENQFSNLLIN